MEDLHNGRIGSGLHSKIFFIALIPSKSIIKFLGVAANSRFVVEMVGRRNAAFKFTQLLRRNKGFFHKLNRPSHILLHYHTTELVYLTRNYVSFPQIRKTTPAEEKTMQKTMETSYFV